MKSHAEKVKEGKKNRRKGKEFELEVRKDLEKREWIVCKWGNNVELEIQTKSPDVQSSTDKSAGKTILTITQYEKLVGKLVASKPKFNPFTKSIMMNSSGFPDFIAYKKVTLEKEGNLMKGVVQEDDLFDEDSELQMYINIGVECKSGKYLSQEEKQKCKWLLEKGIFARILIASKNKEGEIEYNEFEG